MRADLLSLLAGAVIGVLLAVIGVLIWKARYTAAIRVDAVLRSQAVIAGKVHEQILPYLPGFPYNPKDVRFLGSPVDLVVFDGLSEGELRGIVFVEVKTGRAVLSGRERRVRNVVEARAVTWAELRVA